MGATSQTETLNGKRRMPRPWGICVPVRPASKRARPSRQVVPVERGNAQKVMLQWGRYSFRQNRGAILGTLAVANGNRAIVRAAKPTSLT